MREPEGGYALLYFAYGSNMDPVQMRQRCPDSAVVGTAVLGGHALCFPRLSALRKCGVASYEPHPERDLWGVVYRMSADDFVRLDNNEGYLLGRATEQNAYNRIEISVKLNAVPTPVQTYLAIRQDGVHLPSLAYLKHLRDGARHHGLPAEYQAMLASLSPPQSA